jgi:uncharacterized damage-inducible protein DinB
MLRIEPAVLALTLALPTLAGAQPPAGATLKADYLTEMADVEKKLQALAEAIPEDKYGWRPAEGVRSVSEVFLHVAGGNYFLVGMTGVKPPADVPKDIEKVTGKKDILAWMNKSFAHLHAALEAATPESLAKEVDFFGEKTTQRGLYLKAYGHMSEHLGQAIAYARSNGVTPPWSKGN